MEECCSIFKNSYNIKELVLLFEKDACDVDLENFMKKIVFCKEKIILIINSAMILSMDTDTGSFKAI